MSGQLKWQPTRLRDLKLVAAPVQGEAPTARKGGSNGVGGGVRRVVAACASQPASAANPSTNPLRINVSFQIRSARISPGR